MSWFQRVFLSSIGKKFWMGLTGIMLCLFIAFHFVANLLFFLGPEVYNGFSGVLEKIPILLFLELGLALLFLLHIFLGALLWFDNRGARGDRYAKYGTKRGGVSTTVSKTMIYSGLIIVVYLVLHVNTFVFVDDSVAEALAAKTQAAGAGHGAVEGAIHVDYHALIIDVFSHWYHCLWYVIGVIVLAFHVSHGFQSAFRSIGVNHDVYTPFLVGLSRVVGVIVGVGFASIPLYVFFQGA